MSQELDVNQQAVNFYTPVDSIIQTDILKKIKSESISVTFKIYDLHSKSNFVQVEGNALSIIRRFPYDYEGADIYCSFDYLGVQHFFRTKVSTSANYYLLTDPERIYKLQRRQDFRVAIPASVPQACKIIELPKLKCLLRDISLGGCRMAIETEKELELLLETDMTLFIQFLEFAGITIEATIVFLKYAPENKTQLLGLKFTSIDSDAVADLHRTLIQVDRIIRGKDV